MSKIKFFLTPFYIPDNYSPEAIAIAEGLHKIGIEFSSNINYWYQPEKDKYLFNADEHDNYDIAIYEYKYVYPFLDSVLNRMKKNKINILIDRNDWLSPKWYKEKKFEAFDLILACHLLSNIDYPRNVIPWSIGLTDRIITYVDIFSDIDKTKQSNSIASNFRVPHNLRRRLLKSLNPLLKERFMINDFQTDTTSEAQKSIKGSDIDNSYWEQTARRHNPRYYQLLNESKLTYTFGGYYEYRPILFQPYSLIDKFKRRPYIIYSKIL